MPDSDDSDAPAGAEAEDAPAEDAPAADWVLSFYRFYAVANPPELRDAVEAACVERGLLGTVLIAAEGVNAALAGSRPNLESLLAEHFPNTPNTPNTPNQLPNWTIAAPMQRAFRHLKVRVKEEIVGFGRTLAPDAPVGEHVDAAAWDQLVADPEVRVVDTRNDYESHIGTFRGSTLAATPTFRDFVDFAERTLDPAKDKRVALFCTGGIRCEKASAYLLEKGFEQVYQLKGGILSYLAAHPPSKEESRLAPASGRFQGECFVFDERVSVTDDLDIGNHRLCTQCGWPLPREPQAACSVCGR